MVIYKMDINISANNLFQLVISVGLWPMIYICVMVGN